MFKTTVGARVQTIADKIAWRLTPGYYLWKARGLVLRRPTIHARAVDLVRRLVPNRDVVGTRRSRLKEDAKECGDALRRDGFVRLGRMLDARDVTALTSFLDSQQARDPWAPGSASFVGRDPPVGAHVGQYFRASVMRSAFALELANDPAVLGIAKDFLGATPTLSDMNAWWSYDGPSNGREAQTFHRDRDDIRFCKLFIYLTDVDMSTGPHVYVRGSADSPALREERRHTDEEVIAAFGAERIEYFCADAGQAFMVDTSGLHKGLLPTNGRRLIFEAHYSLLPVGSARYEKDPQVTVSDQYDRYVNRLLIKG